jgi:hypothetical protein
MGLSATVAAAVNPAADMVEALVARLLEEHGSAPGKTAAA